MKWKWPYKSKISRGIGEESIQFEFTARGHLSEVSSFRGHRLDHSASREWDSKAHKLAYVLGIRLELSPLESTK